jgi:hypothetical protein
MDNDRILTFHIGAFTPETMPLARLAEYMGDLAALLGKEHAVHFLGLAPGSTRLNARVEVQDVPKVMIRLSDLHRGNAAKEIVRIFEQIDERLANDNAVGWIADARAASGEPEILSFPGRDRQKQKIYGPFTQEGHLDGVLISVGGRDDPAALQLQSGTVFYTGCEADRVLARQLAKHLDEPIRIHGKGRWRRENNGRWTLVSFKVQRFEVFEETSLAAAVQSLRSISGAGWAESDDLFNDLAFMRDDEGGLH